jgi:hypothetical protein
LPLEGFGLRTPIGATFFLFAIRNFIRNFIRIRYSLFYSKFWIKTLFLFVFVIRRINDSYSLFELRSNNEKPYSTEHWLSIPTFSTYFFLFFFKQNINVLRVRCVVCYCIHKSQLRSIFPSDPRWGLTNLIRPSSPFFNPRLSHIVRLLLRRS